MTGSDVLPSRDGGIRRNSGAGRLYAYRFNVRLRREAVNTELFEHRSGNRVFSHRDSGAGQKDGFSCQFVIN